MLSTFTPNQLVPTDHPIRRIKPIVDRAMAELSLTFDVMYTAALTCSQAFPEHAVWNFWGRSLDIPRPFETPRLNPFD
jgi:hypothetical protein